MKILAYLLASTLFATAAAHADVFIYRGVDKVTADLAAGASLGKGLNVFLVVDYEGAQFGTVIFGRIGGGKHFQKTNAVTHNFATALIPKGHTASTIVSGTTEDTSPTEFSNNALLFRGTDKGLLIRKTPSLTLANRPNVLKGTGVNSSRSGSTVGFIEQHLGLTFQGVKTIKANNANQTINQTLDALVTELTAKGYTSI